MKGVNILKKCQQPKKKTKYELFMTRQKHVRRDVCYCIEGDELPAPQRSGGANFSLCSANVCVCVFVPLHLWWEDFLLASPDLETPGANRVY